jgi:hypothetical protein
VYPRTGPRSAAAKIDSGFASVAVGVCATDSVREE